MADLLTVGALRRAFADLPDSTPVTIVIDDPSGQIHLKRAAPAAHDGLAGLVIPTGASPLGGNPQLGEAFPAFRGATSLLAWVFDVPEVR